MVIESSIYPSLVQTCHISGRFLVVNLLIAIICINRISADPAPINYHGVINPLSFNDHKMIKRDLYDPTLSFQEQGWFARFLLNLLGYSIILIPGGLIVFMVKNKSCLPQVQSFSLVRLFVYGKEDATHAIDVELQPGSDDDTKVHSSINASSTNVSRILKLVYYFVGLQISFLAWGLLQEKIMTTEYKVNNSSDTKDTVIRFRDSQFLVLANRVLALVFSLMALVLMRTSSGTKKNGRAGQYVNMTNTRVYLIAPLYEFSFCSLSNVLSSWCQYEALKYVNFPTQVLSKACKILPVMLMARFVSGKRFRSYEYLIAVSISLGMSLFLWGNHTASSRVVSDASNETYHGIKSAAVVPINAGLTGHHGNGHHETAGNGSEPSNYSLFDGLIVLSLYLTFDSFTSNWQERLNTKYKVSAVQMMAAVNCYSILLTATSLGQQGDLIPALRIVLSSSQLTMDCLVLSLMSASGQLFIFYTINAFGAFVFTIMMTLRQSFAIILSCVIYGHALNYVSIIGIVIVFVSLFSQIYFKSGTNKK